MIYQISSVAELNTERLSRANRKIQTAILGEARVRSRNSPRTRWADCLGRQRACAWPVPLGSVTAKRWTWAKRARTRPRPRVVSTSKRRLLISLRQGRRSRLKKRKKRTRGMTLLEPHLGREE